MVLWLNIQGRFCMTRIFQACIWRLGGTVSIKPQQYSSLLPGALRHKQCLRLEMENNPNSSAMALYVHRCTHTRWHMNPGKFFLLLFPFSSPLQHCILQGSVFCKISLISKQFLQIHSLQMIMHFQVDCNIWGLWRLTAGNTFSLMLSVYSFINKTFKSKRNSKNFAIYLYVTC